MRGRIVEEEGDVVGAESESCPQQGGDEFRIVARSWKLRQFGVRIVADGDDEAELARITSYNVCYTKLLRDTPLLSAITVLEVLQAAKLVGSETFRYVEPLTLVGVLFLVLSLLSAAAIRWMEGRLRMEG